MKRVMIISGETAIRSKHEVFTMLDGLKPTDVIVRNKSGVDAFAYAWAGVNHVRAVRMPLSSMVKHLIEQRPDVVLNFGPGRDRTATDFLRVVRNVRECHVIPVRY